jgi:tetratricopeptide (TPR) repeat protein
MTFSMRGSLNMTRAIYIPLLALACSINPAVALDMSVRPNAAEMMRLPPFCSARLNAAQGSPEWNAWRERVGENFVDIHHYCFGLVAIDRYWGARTQQDRSFYLQRAMNNFDYIVKAAKPDFALRADVYSDRGALFKLMGKPGEATKDFDKAISINPRLVKPYLQLADLHVAGKSPKRALETITEGLRHVPASTALQRRYLELGGKKPFPDPIVAKAVEPPSAQPEAAASKPEAAAEPAEAAADGSKAEPAAQTGASPTIGTPQNPYCRFCPPE